MQYALKCKMNMYDYYQLDSYLIINNKGDNTKGTTFTVNNVSFNFT